MSKSELVYEFLGSRNLNTTPIDITGLQGNTYDYELAAFFEVEGSGVQKSIYFNNDLTSNYRLYRMEGDGSSASSGVNDSEGNPLLVGHSYSYPSLSITKITGSSGGERLIDLLVGISATSGDTRIRKQTIYWKNTLDEVTSLQIKSFSSVTSNCHILLYRVPKAASQGNWEKVDELTWAAETAEKSFTGLDGNRDKKYKVVWDAPNVGLSTHINGDSAGNYTVQNLRNQNGSIAANNTASDTKIFLSGQGEMILNASTGTKRLATTSNSQTVSFQQFDESTWYSNTVTNITTLDCTPTASATGTATLYRMKGNGETDGSLPWELIEEVDVSGDFSSGHVFSNLTGNSEKLFRVEFLGEPITASLLCRFNSDSGSNYPLQWLAASTSTPSAGSSTETYIPLTQANVANVPVHGNLIIYPKSGQQRPALIETVSRENLMYKFAGWWTNTIDEINSILIYSSNTDVVTGKLKLWRLK